MNKEPDLTETIDILLDISRRSYTILFSLCDISPSVSLLNVHQAFAGFIHTCVNGDLISAWDRSWTVGEYHPNFHNFIHLLKLGELLATFKYFSMCLLNSPCSSTSSSTISCCFFSVSSQQFLTILLESMTTAFPTFVSGTRSLLIQVLVYHQLKKSMKFVITYLSITHLWVYNKISHSFVSELIFYYSCTIYVLMNICHTFPVFCSYNVPINFLTET